MGLKLNITIMSNYSKTNVAAGAQRVELHDVLGLTGAEVSVNTMAAGSEVPFFHAHKQNEEIYFIVSGRGFMEIDGETVELAAGDWLRVAPEAKRKLHAVTDMTEVCIQVKVGSLAQWTMTDAVL